MSVASLPALGPVDLAGHGSPDGAPALATLETAAAVASTSGPRDGAGGGRGSWAHSRLSFAVDVAVAGHYDEALAIVGEVVREMKGQTLGEDALRGEDAIRRRVELGCLNPDGQVFRAVQGLATEDMRGTRWARLFP